MKTQYITYSPILRLWNERLPYSFEPFININNNLSEDFSETERNYILSFKLTDFKKREISIRVINNQLIIKGTHKKRDEFSSFYKSIPTSNNMDINNINASLKKDNLIIKIPKTKINYREIPVGETYATPKDSSIISKENWIRRTIHSFARIWNRNA